ncbi:replication initiator protein A [Aurantivibrio plasticivorans]
MCENTKKISPLLPDRRKQAELFVCDIFDAVPKGDIASMEHPIFSLSTNPDMKNRRYEHGNKWLEVHPSSYGLATVHDRDVLIFCISQVIGAINDGRPISKTLRFNAIDLLIATNRGTDGRAYGRLKSAMNRLQGTQIETNILTGGKEQIDIFSLVDRVKIVRETREGQMLEIEIALSEWVFNAIEAKEVLTYSPKYFRLRKPLERRLYDLARKHCGQKENWAISTEKLRKKSGSVSSIGEFNRLLESIINDDKEHNHLPDYSIRYAQGDDGAENKCLVEFKNRKPKKHIDSQFVDFPILNPDTYEKARKVAPQFDVYYLEQEWLEMWVSRGKEKLNNPDGAFLNFCKKRYNLDKGLLL